MRPGRNGEHASGRDTGCELMRIDSGYTLAARDDIASAIDHYMLRRLPEHRRNAVLDLCRGTEMLLKEKLSLIRPDVNVDRVEWPELLGTLDQHVDKLPTHDLWRLRRIRGWAAHEGECPRLTQLEEVTKSIFPFIWRFLQAELDFAPGEGFDTYHAAILKGESLTLCAKAKLLSVAAMRHVYEEPQYGVEFADLAVDCIVRDLAQGCGLDQERMSFAELLGLLSEIGDDCAPWYAIPLLDGDYSPLRCVTPDFIEHVPGGMDKEAAESHVVEARYVVTDIAMHLHRPEWEARIRLAWNEILDVLARTSPTSYQFVPESLSDQSPMHVYGDIIQVKAVRLGDRTVSADIEDAIRHVIPDLPPEFRVEVRGPSFTVTNSYQDDLSTDSSDI